MAAMGTPDEIQPSCAICNAPAEPECPHESERLKIALEQAMMRSVGLQQIRTWVLDRARLEVTSWFKQLKSLRLQEHLRELQALPCYALYQHHHGRPPLHRDQLNHLIRQINECKVRYQMGINADWSRSCMRYPEVLDHYFNMVHLSIPRGAEQNGGYTSHDTDSDGPEPGRKYRDRASSGSRDHGHRERRRHARKRRVSRHRSPRRFLTEPPPIPPAPYAPMPGHY